LIKPVKISSYEKILVAISGRCADFVAYFTCGV
jgi:hypothetical protein